MPSDKPVIITTCGPAIQPYWVPLLKDYNLIMTVERTASEAKALGWQVKFLGEFISGAQKNALWQIVSELQTGIDWKAAVTKFEFPGWDVKAKSWLQGYTFFQLSEILPRLVALDNARSTEPIAGVIMHDDITNEGQLYAQWAKARHVPSVHVAHGGYGSRDWHEGEDRDIHLKLTADVVCVWNEIQAGAYIRQGARPEQVVVTGPGVQDKWAKMVPDRKASKLLLDLDPDKPMVAFLGDFATRLRIDQGYEIITKGVEDFLEAAKLLPDWQILMNPHPGTHSWNEAYFKQRMEAHGVKGKICTNHIEHVAQAADVLFSATGSQAQIEAGIINRPSVKVTRRDGVEWVGKDNLKFFVLCSDDPKSIADAIRMARGNETTPEWLAARDRIVYDFLWLCDGHATERTLDVIRNHIGKPA